MFHETARSSPRHVAESLSAPERLLAHAWMVPLPLARAYAPEPASVSIANAAAVATADARRIVRRLLITSP
jgi:hypothetical protein